MRVTANTHAPGLAGARNTGLDLAAADYVATCDDDDVWHPEKLEAQGGYQFLMIDFPSDGTTESATK